MKHKYISILFLCLLGVSCGTSEKENPAFNWKVGGSLSGQTKKGLAGPVVGVSQNRLLIGGGSNFPDAAPWEGGAKKYYADLQLYRMQNDSIILVKNKIKLPYKVAYSANVTTEKGIVIAGGENEDKVLSKVRLINWDSTHQKLTVQKLPNLPERLTAGAMAHLDNQLFFAGGQNEKTVSDKLYRLDLKHPEQGWDSLPNIPHKVTHAVLYAEAATQNPGLYMIGGRKRNFKAASTLYKAVYRFDLEKEKWVEKSSLPYALSAYTGLSWKGGQLLVFSGDRGKTFHKTEQLIIEISRVKDSAKRAQLIKDKNQLQQSHPGFEGTVLGYNLKRDQWRKVNAIPFPGQVTTTAIKWNDKVVIPGGEIRAGVRTPKIILGTPK